MNFCHIAPTSLLDELCLGQRTHLVLAHLVESDDEYAAWYKNNTGFKIMDNSAFEMYKQGRPMYPADQLIEQAERCNADVIVMSDYPGEPWEVTRDSAIAMGPQLKKAGYQTMYVPQAPIGDIHNLHLSFRWACTQPYIDYVAFSILAIPNAYGVEKDNRLQRFLSRWSFLTSQAGQTTLEHINEYGKKVHFLGMVDGPAEISLMKSVPNLHITSWDSSSAVWHGLNCISFDTSPTGLLHGKLESEVDFSLSRNSVDGSLLTMAKYNIFHINQLAGQH